MKTKTIFFLVYAVLASSLFSQSAQSVFDEVNTRGRDFSTMRFEANMEINSRGRVLTKTFFGFLDDSIDASFMEYTNAQDAGTRYLKLGSDMWIYIPDAGDVLKLSGHLLRDSMMGSDISYDDMADQGSFEEEYMPEKLGSDFFEGKEVYVLTIRAKDENKATYVRQDLYIEKESFNVLKSVMFATGRNEDRAIKEFIMKDYEEVGSLSMPMTLEVIDLRKKNSKTIVLYTDIEVDVLVDSDIFTRAYLER